MEIKTSGEDFSISKNDQLKDEDKYTIQMNELPISPIAAKKKDDESLSNIEQTRLSENENLLSLLSSLNKQEQQNNNIIFNNNSIQLLNYKIEDFQRNRNFKNTPLKENNENDSLRRVIESNPFISSNIKTKFNRIILNNNMPSSTYKSGNNNFIIVNNKIIRFGKDNNNLNRNKNQEKKSEILNLLNFGTKEQKRGSELYLQNLFAKKNPFKNLASTLAFDRPKQSSTQTKILTNTQSTILNRIRKQEEDHEVDLFKIQFEHSKHMNQFGRLKKTHSLKNFNTFRQSNSNMFHKKTPSVI